MNKVDGMMHLNYKEMYSPIDWNQGCQNHDLDRRIVQSYDLSYEK